MNKILKTIGAATVATMMFAVVAVPAPAQAQTIAELQAMIEALTAQIAALTGGSTTTTTSGYMFSRDLTIGATGTDVMELQKFLNAKGFTVNTAGAGAPGQESSYFGGLTAAALAKYQASQGIAPAVGYFGPITRANVNAMNTTTTTDGDDDDDSDTGSGDLEGGAGDITVTERNSGVEDEVIEGEDEVSVLGFEIEADGSDVRVTSIRVEFEHEGAGSDRLDRYVEEVQIMMGNKVVGTADVDDFSESSDVYSENISISNAVIREDDEERFYVAVTAVNNIDSNDLSENWEVAVGQIRFEDSTGAILTDSTGTGVNGSISEIFTFEDLGSAGDVELTVTEDDNSINDAHTVQVDDSSNTNDVEILSFEIEAKGSDMYLEQIIFDITSNSGTGVTEIANDFRLMMGSEEIGTVSYDLDQDNTGGDSSASSTDEAIAIIITDIDDDDVVIDEGDMVSFTLVADINDIDGGFADGDTLSVSLANADITAEDENGDTVTDLNGSASSGPIAFNSTGLMVDVTSTPTPTYLTGLADDSTDDQGQFVIEFDVEAFEDTAWVELTAASSTDAAGDNLGVAFSMENASTGAAAQTGTTTAILERVSGGTLSSGFVRINAGQTAKFRLTVNHDAATTAFYRVQMNQVGFNQTSAADADQAKALTPESDYESASIQVQN